MELVVLCLCGVEDQLAGLCELELGDELLDEVVSLLDKALVRLVKLVLVEEVVRLVPHLLEVADLRLHGGDLATLARDDLAQVEYVLRRALVLELLHQVFQLAHSHHQPLSVEHGALERVIRHRVLLGKLEEFQLFSHLFKLQVQILHLHRHRLIVIDQGSLFFGVDSDLLDQILSSRSLIRLLLAQRQALVGLDELTLGVDDHGLELISLPNELLAIRIDLLLQLQILLQECVPFPLALTLSPLMLLYKATQLTKFLTLSLKYV